MDISRAAAAYQNTNTLGGSTVRKVQEALNSESDSSGSTGGTNGLGPSFADLVSQGLDQARSEGYKTEAISTEALTNKTELNDLVAAISNMDLTLSTVVAVRDRMINAYQDIIKMPI